MVTNLSLNSLKLLYLAIFFNLGALSELWAEGPCQIILFENSIGVNRFPPESKKTDVAMIKQTAFLTFLKKNELQCLINNMTNLSAQNLVQFGSASPDDTWEF